MRSSITRLTSRTSTLETTAASVGVSNSAWVESIGCLENGIIIPIHRKIYTNTWAAARAKLDAPPFINLSLQTPVVYMAPQAPRDNSGGSTPLAREMLSSLPSPLYINEWITKYCHQAELGQRHGRNRYRPRPRSKQLATLTRLLRRGGRGWTSPRSFRSLRLPTL